MNDLVRQEDAALTRTRAPMAIIPQTRQEVADYAVDTHNSQLAPRELNSPQKIFVAVCYGLEVGLTPQVAIQSIAVINGRPCMWGDALLGIVMASGLLEDMEETLDEETMTATCMLTRAGMKSPVISTFSQADAEKAGLWSKKGPWQEYPKRMLQMRARGFAIRDRFPDVTKGLIIREEASDIPAPDKEEQKQSRLARIQEAAGGTDGEGFGKTDVDAEIEEAVVEEVDQSEPEEAMEAPEIAQEAETAPEEEIPTEDATGDPERADANRMEYQIKSVHSGLYQLKTKRAIDNFYRTNYKEKADALPTDQRVVIEKIYDAHVDRVSGNITPEAAAGVVKEAIAKVKGEDDGDG